MPGHRPTVRSLATELGLSRSTVSLALRGSKLIKAATRDKVATLAAARGYKLNPLTSLLMGNLKNSQAFRGVIGVVSMDESDRPVKARHFRELLREGARARALALGFKVQNFSLSREGMTFSRLDSVLRARGIRGVLLLPVWRSPDFSKLDWNYYAGVYADYLIEHTPLHTVCSDHYRSMLDALQQVRYLGYRRPGLFLVKPEEERLHYCWSNRWASAFLGYQHSESGIGKVPPLIAKTLEREPFQAWFLRYKPDVVLGHVNEAIDWMQETGARVPETHGFVCLNLALKDRPCAGLELQAQLLAARGIELLIAQIQHNQFGMTNSPSATMLPGEWRAGPTVRAQ